MIWTIVGYFPKRRATRVGWVSPYRDYPDAQFPVPPPVEEICSVSSCIAQRPDTSMEQVPFNEFCGYDSPSSAWQAVPPEQRADFELFAYRIAPMLFKDGVSQDLQVSAADIAPLPDTFIRLGYDAVELQHGYCLGCSPLSCNQMVVEMKLNRYCLVETEQEGMELARQFSVSKPEPGPYAVAEVWRHVQGAHI